MSAYIIRRLILIIPTFLIVTMIIFFTIRLIPGSIIDLMLAEQATVVDPTVDVRADLEQRLGLDVPIHVQYVRWIGNVFRGDLGNSLWKNYPVTEELIHRFPVSFELGILAIIISLLISIPIGTYSAIRQDTIGDYLARSFAIICIAIPSFWLGTMIVVFPSIWWNWTPPLKLIPFTEHPIENLKQFIIPAALTGMMTSGVTMRMTRTMMLEVLRQDYIRTAWSKGLSERIVVIRHAMRNALIPVVTLIGLQLPVLIGGSIVLEQIFALPGIGRLTVEVLNNRDYTVLSGINLFLTASVLLINLVVDLTYAYLDPRVQYK